MEGDGVEAGRVAMLLSRSQRKWSHCPRALPASALSLQHQDQHTDFSFRKKPCDSSAKLCMAAEPQTKFIPRRSLHDWMQQAGHRWG